jgi:hypothetical protein
MFPAKQAVVNFWTSWFERQMIFQMIWEYHSSTANNLHQFWHHGSNSKCSFRQFCDIMFSTADDP